MSDEKPKNDRKMSIEQRLDAIEEQLNALVKQVKNLYADKAWAREQEMARRG